MKKTYTTLITPSELAPLLADPAWVVFDCRFTLTDPDAGKRAYSQDHIPGARYAHLNDDLSSSITATSGRHPLPNPDILARKLGAWGVNNASQVVVYDATFGAMAARMWWLLRWLGHERVALLDGGYPRWQREGLPVTNEVALISPATFQPQLRPELCVNAEVVDDIRVESAYKLIDARSEERFRGEVEPLDKVAGHVPGALNHPFDDNLDYGGNFLVQDELRAGFIAKIAAVDPHNVVHMCGSGVTACHNILAMEHVGLKGSKLYAGSWSEWITDPQRPVATGQS